jgi:predicted enzyme related to lactoylglutathione lyase
MERVTGIGGVFMRSRDPEALAAWYAQHLGLPVTPGDATAELPWEGPGATLWAAFPHDTEYFGRAGSECMLNFRVADLEAMLTQLRSAGVKVEPDVEESAYGRFGWTVDPEGRRIELWEPPAASESEEEAPEV